MAAPRVYLSLANFKSSSAEVFVSSKIGIEGCVPVVDKSKDQIAHDIEKWRDLGATHISLTTIPEEWVESERRWHRLYDADRGINGIQPHVDIIENFAQNFPEYLNEDL